MKFFKKIILFFFKLLNRKKIKENQEIENILVKEIFRKRELKRKVNSKIVAYVKKTYGGNSKYFKRKSKCRVAILEELNNKFKDDLANASLYINTCLEIKDVKG